MTEIAEEKLMTAAAEARAHLHRFKLMCANWVERHGAEGEELFLQYMREVVGSDRRLFESIRFRVVDDHLEELIADGILLRLPGDRITETFDFIAQGIAVRPPASTEGGNDDGDS